MKTRSLSAPCLVAAVAVAALARPAASQGMPALSPAELARNEARALQQRGEYGAARFTLERALSQCGEGRQCRALLALSLGDLLRGQGQSDRPNRETHLRQAVDFYDLVLREVPDQPEALYNKALAYRSLGPHEWQEGFFQQVAERDPSRQGIYFSFLGDYYAGRELWDQAATAYRRALGADPDDGGARSGLVDALRTLGRPGIPELLRRAAEWELRDAGSAAEAYGAALAVAFSPEGVPPDTSAGSALVGLVSVRARSGRALGAIPPEVPTEWVPCAQLRAFLERPGVGGISWWSAQFDRSASLALAALARGRQAVTEGRLDLAEAFWQVGTRLAPSPSGVRVDIQRELAMLYFRHPTLDPSRGKFARLEHEIFIGKGAALAAGDLEAAQRYHTALGLIYAERGPWRGPFARNAVDQLTWALTKADERLGLERFYQPLAELRALLARGLDSIGDRETARQWHLSAATAYFDIDDFAGAIRSLRAAGRVATTWPGPEWSDSVWAFRYSPTVIKPRTPGSCSREAPQKWAATAGEFGAGFRDPTFQERQRFKILADCARGVPSLEYSLDAFRVVEGGRLTLVGTADIARFERVLAAILNSVKITARETHLDLAPRPDGSAIPVSLPSETRALWLAVAPDDLAGARVMAALGGQVKVSWLRVAGGMVELHTPKAVPESVLARLRRIPGVREVVVVEGA